MFPHEQINLLYVKPSISSIKRFVLEMLNELYECSDRLIHHVLFTFFFLVDIA